MQVIVDKFVFRVLRECRYNDANVWAQHAGNRVHRALQSAQKYSLVADSVKSEIVVEPTIEIER